MRNIEAALYCTEKKFFTYSICRVHLSRVHRYGTRVQPNVRYALPACVSYKTYICRQLRDGTVQTSSITVSRDRPPSSYGNLRRAPGADQLNRNPYFLNLWVCSTQIKMWSKIIFSVLNHTKFPLKKPQEFSRDRASFARSNTWVKFPNIYKKWVIDLGWKAQIFYLYRRLSSD